MTIDDAITTVAENEATITEVPVASGLRMLDGDTLLMGESAYRLEGAGFRRYCEQLSAPAGYVEDLPGRVRLPLLQHHLDCSDLSPGRLTLIARGGEFLAFGRPELLRISSRDVLEAVQDGADCELHVHHLEFSDESFQADLLIERESEAVAVGDVVRPGLRVTHSMIGDHATWIESFFFRLVCENGLTHRDCVDRRAARTRRLSVEHPDARELQKEQVRRLAADTSGTLRGKLDAIRELRREKVDVNQLTSRFLEHGGMSTRIWLPVVREAWQAEGSEATAFGVMNALTRVATHREGISARHRRILGGLAGVLAFRQLHICPRCFTHLRGPAAVVTAEQ